MRDAMTILRALRDHLESQAAKTVVAHGALSRFRAETLTQAEGLDGVMEDLEEIERRLKEINDDAVLFHRQFCAAMDSLADPDGGK